MDNLFEWLFCDDALQQPFHFHCTSVGICTWLGVLIDTLSLGYPMPYVSLCKKRCARLNMKPSCTTHAHTAFNPVLRFFLEILTFKCSEVPLNLKANSPWNSFGHPQSCNWDAWGKSRRQITVLFILQWMNSYIFSQRLYTVYIILNPVLGGLETVFPATSWL